MLRVAFHDLEETRIGNLKFSVIVAFYGDKLVFVRHRERETWEVPGGHIEWGEHPDQAAARELHEESGAVDFTVSPVCDYSVEREDRIGYGRLYMADVRELGPLPGSEIEEVCLGDEPPGNWTYEAIQPLLVERVKLYKESMLETQE